MNDTRPPFWSKRFWHIFTVALAGDPIRALKGVYWFVTRRRVRGWGQLLVSASLSEQAYGRWISGSEPTAFDSYRAIHPDERRSSICVLIVGEDSVGAAAAARTVDSVHRAFGPAVRLYTSVDPARADSVLPSDVDAMLDAIAADADCEWLLPLLAGDVVSPAAGDILRRALARATGAGLIYWDEDAVEAGHRCDPWIKPQWDELLFGQLGGLAGASVMSISAARIAAKSLTRPRMNREGLERLQLSVAGSTPTSAVHIPLILTHRSERTRLPLLPRIEFSGTVVPRTLSRSDMPKVSLIIPTRDRADLLEACLKGIAATSYSGELELIIVDNGTVEPDAIRIIREHEAIGAKVIRDDGPFNFSRLNNAAAKIATGKFLCFYNNDVEPIEPQWLNWMMRHAVDERSGAVGALLLYPSGKVQHAGVVIGLGGAAGHVQKGVPAEETKFRTWHTVTREVSAVTGAVMVVRKIHFEMAGCFDEDAFPVAFNDVDLCLRLKQSGLRNIFVAEARLLHRESESRGDDRRPERAAKFAAELRALQQRWKTESFDDPHYSPLFLRSTERCVLVP